MQGGGYGCVNGAYILRAAGESPRQYEYPYH